MDWVQISYVVEVELMTIVMEKSFVTFKQTKNNTNRENRKKLMNISINGMCDKEYQFG